MVFILQQSWSFMQISSIVALTTSTSRNSMPRLWKRTKTHWWFSTFSTKRYTGWNVCDVTIVPIHSACLASMWRANPCEEHINWQLHWECCCICIHDALTTLTLSPWHIYESTILWQIQLFAYHVSIRICSKFQELDFAEDCLRSTSSKAISAAASCKKDTELFHTCLLLRPTTLQISDTCMMFICMLLEILCKACVMWIKHTVWCLMFVCVHSRTMTEIRSAGQMHTSCTWLLLK